MQPPREAGVGAPTWGHLRRPPLRAFTWGAVAHVFFVVYALGVCVCHVPCFAVQAAPQGGWCWCPHMGASVPAASMCNAGGLLGSV